MLVRLMPRQEARMVSRCATVAGPTTPPDLTRDATEAIAWRDCGAMCCDLATVASAAACTNERSCRHPGFSKWPPWPEVVRPNKSGKGACAGKGSQIALQTDLHSF